jgi:tricorn protease
MCSAKWVPNLHLFVYGGEYNSPDAPPLGPASLGVSLKRSPEWSGYTITEIPQRDPDFNMMDMVARYCPLSDQALRLSGQKGLKVGDVIVAINGESVMQGPDINLHLRGQAGRSVRLDVLRFQSGPGLKTNNGTVVPVPLMVVPITPEAADSLRYDAWEWKTRQMAKMLARDNNFTLGYIHMRAMDREGEDAFARGFFPDYDKDSLIIDVRHNLGGNIDSWILTFLQRKAWMYWGGRGFIQPGDLDYDEQFAFRGKVIVLIDEHTSSNGEGVARGISELGLGKLMGTRTWGGGIWGSSANHLVDGGIAAAPQWGTYNENFTWGGGVETTGVSPDIEVDNNPRTAFDGKDEQLERAIGELKTWLKKEPVPPFPVPGKRPDMSLYTDDCPV